MNTSANEHVAQFIDREKSQKDPEFNWDNPESCDLCATSFLFQKYLIDGMVTDTPQKTLPSGETMGQWGYMCSECFVKRGVGIGWGRGQLYEKTPDDEWLLVGGFPPDELNSPEG
jgi:hypothetical protein